MLILTTSRPRCVCVATAIGLRTRYEAGSLAHEYRDRIYIRKDIIVKLTEAGELNQTKLLSYCGLNIVKHKGILDDMEAKGFIEKFSEDWGTKSVTKYRVTERGRQFSKMILEPYEEMFPRKKR